MCKCCEKIEFWKLNKKETDKIFARIAIYGWHEGERRIKGNECFNYTTRAYDLNYCPKCGKKVR